MHEVVTEAVERARAGQGPSLVEGRTYRYEEHSEGMSRILKAPYRSDEEVEQWKQRDPIKLHKERLLTQSVATEQELAQMDGEEKSRADEAVEFARQSPDPDPSELFDDMFAVPIPLE
jgi:pyruvate dehydrogenase E1 component alpha subunit